MEAPNIAAARQAADTQGRRLQEAALDGEQFENDLIAGGLRLDQATMAAVRHAREKLELASAGWDRVTAELGKHAQGEEYAASGHAASTEFLGDDAGGAGGDWEDEAMRAGGGLPAPDEAGSALLHHPVVPVQREGKPPKMTYFPWQTVGRVEVGAVSDGEWYSRCPVCRAWGGSCRASAVARQTGQRHRADEHDASPPAEYEARIAARRVCKDMTAARLDETVARLAAAHALEPSVVLSAVHRTADAIGWRSAPSRTPCSTRAGTSVPPGTAVIWTPLTLASLAL